MNNIKCVIVGDGSVGKTSILLRYTSNTFSQEYVPTIFDNYGCNLKYQDHIVSLVLWDTAGQEDYDRLRPLSYPATDVFLLCFSVIQKSSFRNITEKWIPEIMHHMGKDIPIILVGTKTDLRHKEQVLAIVPEDDIITTECGIKLQKQFGMYDYIECSALENQNIENIFEKAVECFFQKKHAKVTKKRLCHIL